MGNLSFMFSSASALIASRIESLRQAEAALMSFATNRYHDSGGHHESVTHTLELFDTPIPHAKIPIKGRCSQKCRIQIHDSEHLLDDDSFYIHGVKVVSNLYKKCTTENEVKEDKNDEAPLVLLHGYMNGSLYFYRNLIGLANHCFGGTVYALDLLGWGLSSRPNFKPSPIKGNEYEDDTHVAEQIFVESIEEWRKAHNIKKMTLGGHSMGGYIAVAYVEKYPQYVDRLILISPAGVPDDKDYDMDRMTTGAPLRVKIIFGLAKLLWNNDITPASIVRNMPETRSQNMVENYVERRLPSIDCPDERSHLTKYLFMNSKLPGSGEYFLNKFLKPTSFALKPLIHRIPKLSLPHVSIIYGQNDWMDPTGGIRTKELCNKMRQNEEGNVPNIDVYGVSNAGHLLMLENWREFNNAMFAAAGKDILPRHPTPFKVLGSQNTFFKAGGFQKRINKEDPQSRR